ncbi:purine-nucleoside phosphorylase [candidate division KSB1 bacterium]|nr:purine-nucleoside phosphorylase [candidate division KSB1 bacterium]
MKEKTTKAASYLLEHLHMAPHIGLILGTGLGDLGERIQQKTVIPYAEIPYFPESTVQFHAGKLISGELGSKQILAMQGRFHYYEGYPMHEITLPVRVMYQLGIRTLIISNAAGGIRQEFAPGTLALVNDHINLMGDNPLIGPYETFLGSRFPDMSEPYSRLLRDLAHKTADDLGIELLDCIYAAVSGPNFETRAEIRMLQAFNVDSIGMSVVPEVLVARQLAMDVLAINAITDQALPEKMQPISHEQVSRVAKEITPTFNLLVEEIIKRI